MTWQHRRRRLARRRRTRARAAAAGCALGGAGTRACAARRGVCRAGAARRGAAEQQQMVTERRTPVPPAQEALPADHQRAIWRDGAAPSALYRLWREGSGALQPARLCQACVEAQRSPACRSSPCALLPPRCARGASPRTRGLSTRTAPALCRSVFFSRAVGGAWRPAPSACSCRALAPLSPAAARGLCRPLCAVAHAQATDAPTPPAEHQLCWIARRLIADARPTRRASAPRAEGSSPPALLRASLARARHRERSSSAAAAA